MSDRSDDDRSTLDQFLRHPVTTVTTGLGLTGQGLGVVDPFGFVASVGHIVLGTADTWFPILGAFRHLGRLVDFIPAGMAQQAFVAGAAVYVAYLLSSLVVQWINQFKQLLKRNKS